jgi:hypothetical protein
MVPCGVLLQGTRVNGFDSLILVALGENRHLPTRTSRLLVADEYYYPAAQNGVQGKDRYY